MVDLMLDLMQDAELIRKVTKKVYWESRFVCLRHYMEEEDLLQVVFLKLIKNDNYKKYTPQYSKVTFLNCVATNCAITCLKKSYIGVELSVMDKSVTETKDTKSCSYKNSLITEFKTDLLDVYPRLVRISANMPEKESHHLAIRYNNKLYPFSISRMFDLFLHLKCQKSELKRYIINIKSNAPVSKVALNAMWNEMYSCAVQELER